jgi:putative sterol carrier protein
MSYQTATDVFEHGFVSRFRADAAAGEKIAYHFKIEGAGDWCIKIEDRTIQIASGDCAFPSDLTITMAESDFLLLANGKEGLQLLFMTGRIRIEGSLPSALKLMKFFPAVTA